jgi:hypothetical protein
MCETWILSNITYLPLVLWRLVYEPLGGLSATCLTLSRRYFGTVLLSYGIESMLIRYLIVTWWRRPPPFNDDFMERYFKVANYLTSLCLTGILSLIPNPGIGRYMGKMPVEQEENNVHF